MSTAEIADFLDLAKRAEDEVNLLISQPELVK
jgi:hypothetical protein